MEYGDDVIQALRTGQNINFNEMLRKIPDPGTDPSEIEKIATNRYVQKVIERKLRYEVNLIQTFVILYQQCSKGMQSKIKAQKNWNKEIYNNLMK